MKRQFVSLALCAALMLCSCSDVSQDTRHSSQAEITAAPQATTAQTSVQTEQSSRCESTTAETTTQAAAQTPAAEQTSKAAQTPEAVPAEYADPSQFVMYTDADCTYHGSEISSASSDAAAAAVSIPCTVKVDQLFSGLRDKEAEKREKLLRQQEAERLERERFEREKLERQQQEQKLYYDEVTAVSGSDSEQQFGYEYAAKDLAGLKAFLSFYYQQSVVEKYAKTYNESFFKTKTLLLKIIVKPAGNKTLPEFASATGSSDTKTITINLRDQEQKTAFTKPSSVIVQAAVSKQHYQTYGSKAVKWQLTFVKYYNYPKAKAKLNEVGWNLQSAFKAAHSIPYYGHTADMPQDDKHTTEWYANYGFTNKKGNCYVMAAMFCEMARLLGYKCVQISGRVRLARGGYGAHSWCEIYVDGEMYICDPNFTNETGYSGYLRHYGEKGTWQYIRDTEVK